MSDEITAQHRDILAKIEAGGNPEMPPLLRKKLRRLGLIVPIDPPRDTRAEGVVLAAPPPRRHALTDAGRERLAAHRMSIVGDQTRHDVAASVARHAGLAKPRP